MNNFPLYLQRRKVIDEFIFKLLLSKKYIYSLILKYK